MTVAHDSRGPGPHRTSPAPIARRPPRVVLRGPGWRHSHLRMSSEINCKLAGGCGCPSQAWPEVGAPTQTNLSRQPNLQWAAGLW